MGTDNLFHKRKERKAEGLRRRQASKAPYDVILIVCEGGKTEPNYFTELKKDRPLSFPIFCKVHGSISLTAQNESAIPEKKLRSASFNTWLLPPLFSIMH